MTQYQGVSGMVGATPIRPEPRLGSVWNGTTSAQGEITRVWCASDGRQMAVVSIGGGKSVAGQLVGARASWPH